MQLRSERIWVVRAGRRGKAHELFIQEQLIALEDADMGDLTNLCNSRHSYLEKYRQYHPDDTNTGAAGISGKYFRFANEISIGDSVLYPSTSTRQVFYGVVESAYKFYSNSNYPHQRGVRWLRMLPKAAFSTQSCYELGAARTLFEFKRNRNELESLLESKLAKIMTDSHI